MKTEDKVRVVTRVSPELREQLNERAREWRISQNQICEFAMQHLLKSVPPSAKIEETLTIKTQNKED